MILDKERKHVKEVEKGIRRRNWNLEVGIELICNA